MANTVKFGRYIQSKDEKKYLDWIVLKRDGKRTLVISKSCVACKHYHDSFDENGDITWVNCSIRRWLNEEFYQNAFMPDEQERILNTDIVIGNEKVTDKIFLLSVDEIGEYMPEQEERIAKPSPYAKKNADIYTKNGYCCWYMRDPSERFFGNATLISIDGSYDLDGSDFVMGRDHGIRPAMWIKI